MAAEIQRICALALQHDGKPRVEILVVSKKRIVTFDHYELRAGGLALLDAGLRPDEIDDRFEHKRLELLCAGAAFDDGHLPAVAKMLGHEGAVTQDIFFRRPPWPEPQSTPVAKIVELQAQPGWVSVPRIDDGLHALLLKPPVGRSRLLALPPTRNPAEERPRHQIENTLRTALRTPPFLAEVQISSSLGELVLLDLLSYDENDVRQMAWGERQTLLRQLLDELHDETLRTVVWNPRPAWSDTSGARLQLQSSGGSYDVQPLIQR